MILIFIISLFLLIYFIFFISQFVNIIFKGNAPFISTDSETIEIILHGLKLKKQPIVYELGCGRARFLKICEKYFPDASLVGIENLASLYFINKLTLKLQGSKINLLNKDFFAVRLENADLIYCYLNNATMFKLGEKFRNECQAGTLIISRRFPIPQLKPEKMIIIKNKKIFFYKI